jgi:hypothetical protein
VHLPLGLFLLCHDYVGLFDLQVLCGLDFMGEAVCAVVHGGVLREFGGAGLVQNSFGVEIKFADDLEGRGYLLFFLFVEFF